MSHFYAEFALSASGCPIRMDTRIYLSRSPSRDQDLGTCIGVIWMCNPGSAGGLFATRPWGAIAGDPTLFRVLNMLQTRFGTPKESNSYVKVLNLFYAVGVSVPAAWNLWHRLGCSYSESVPPSAKFVVFAWGRESLVGRRRLLLLAPSALAGVPATIRVAHSFNGAQAGPPSIPPFQVDHPLGPCFDAAGVARLI